MYCPKCSQQQIADEMSFCSRCGFSLSAVKQLVASGSGLVEPGVEAPPPPLSRGQRVVRKGAWMILGSFVLTIIAGVLTGLEEDLAPILLLPVLCFVISFALILYGAFVADKRARRAKEAGSQPQVAPTMPGQLSADQRIPQLSPPWVAPIASFTAQRVKTAEIVQPPSVTENTTRLLDEESEPRRG